MSLYETGHFDPDLCDESDVLVKAQVDARARMFSVVLWLTFMSTDLDSSAISCLKSFAQVVHI